MAKNITPRSSNYSNWYIDVVTEAKLADYSPVRGSMVIRPRGYALWENIQRVLDGMFKELGHENAYFPLLIPEEFIRKEADHIEGFAPELAVVTHGGGEKLEEPYIIRPTSETIIWSMYKKWIQSYRDLPILINQWANVMRWEKRTRLFLRTSEFLWQEGHTAHATAEEAEAETLAILEVYRKFAQDYMALPVLCGEKSESEKFAGAVRTYAIEAMMQDGKALQAGTSHFLGQNFARAFNVQFQNKAGALDYVWATSWGVSTRLIGALIMAHSDDNGLVLPPRLATTQVAVVPIFRSANKGEILAYSERVCAEIREELRGASGAGLGDVGGTGSPRQVVLDTDEQNSPGWKFAEYELAGVPIRIEIGQRDKDKEQVVLVRRDTGEKIAMGAQEVAHKVPQTLREIQSNVFNRAVDYHKALTQEVDNYADFQRIFADEGGSGFVIAPWDGRTETEERIKSDTKATIRVLPQEKNGEGAKCIVSGRPAVYKAVFARSY